MTKDWKLSFAGLDLPVPDQDGVQFSLQPLDDSNRNADGDLFIQPIAMKRTASVRWGRLCGKDMRALFKTLTENRYGILEFYDPAAGAAESMEAYYGSGASAAFFRYDDDMEKQIWNSVQVNFIEV